VKNYLQRLAAQTWNGLSDAPNPESGSVAGSSDIREETAWAEPSQTRVSPTDAAATTSNRADPVMPVEALHPVPLSGDTTLGRAIGDGDHPPHSARPNDPADTRSTVEALPEDDPPQTPEQKTGTRISLPSRLAGIASESPVIEEVVRWLSQPPVRIHDAREAGGADMGALSKTEIQGEVQTTGKRVDIPIVDPSVASLSPDVREAAKPGDKTVSGKRPEPFVSRPRIDAAGPDREQAPDVTVTIGSIHVTIEAPTVPPPPVRRNEPALATRPAPSEKASRERRNDLSRHYL